MATDDVAVTTATAFESATASTLAISLERQLQQLRNRIAIEQLASALTTVPAETAIDAAAAAAGNRIPSDRILANANTLADSTKDPNDIESDSSIRPKSVFEMLSDMVRSMDEYSVAESGRLVQWPTGCVVRDRLLRCCSNKELLLLMSVLECQP